MRGGKVATDGKILIRVKSDYDSSKEKQVVAKNLLPLDVQFPNYKRVIPEFSKMQEVDFDFQKIKDILKKNDRILKIYKKLSYRKIILHSLSNGSIINNDYMQKIIHFAECFPESKLYAFGDTKSLALATGDLKNPDAVCVFMPCLCGDTVTEIDDSLYLTGDFSDLSETDIIKGCKKIDILQRQEYGTMTEKDIAFLKDVHDFMAIFRKEKKEVA